MLTSLALVFIFGLLLSAVCKLFKLPGIIGMLLTGIILGPCCLNLLDPSILAISGELRQMALIIILIKAGLSLKFSDLKKIGRPAILMSFLPACFEIVAFVAIGPLLLPINYTEAALIGAVLGAVSPAVVIPRMVQLMDEGYGTNKAVPQLLMAGSSLDDIFVIVLFTTFLGMAKGGTADALSFLDIPISIVLGILFGLVVGFMLSWFFNFAHKHNKHIRNSIKVILVLGFAFLLMAIESLLEGKVSMSGLLAVISMAAVVSAKCAPCVTKRLSEKFGKLWLGAEVILFVLVGAAVDINYMAQAGGFAVLMILIALLFRCVGVFVCLLFTKLNFKERLYCVIAYIPKATVQAAIGSVPLAAGLPCGPLVLSIAVLSIIITAPLGAILMDLTYKKLLQKEESKELILETTNEQIKEPISDPPPEDEVQEETLDSQCDKDENKME